MKTLSFYFLVVFILCGSALANAGSIDINLYCKIPGHEDRQKEEGKFNSYVLCLEDGKEIDGDINSEKIKIYGVDVYNETVSSAYIKDGKIQTLKVVKTFAFPAITAEQIHANTKLFCEKYIKDMDLCKISRMMFRVKMVKQDADSSFHYVKWEGHGQYVKIPYKFGN